VIAVLGWPVEPGYNVKISDFIFYGLTGKRANRLNRIIPASINPRVPFKKNPEESALVTEYKSLK
jgi:hypothetical protein